MLLAIALQFKPYKLYENAPPLDGIVCERTSTKDGHDVFICLSLSWVKLITTWSAWPRAPLIGAGVSRVANQIVNSPPAVALGPPNIRWVKTTYQNHGKFCGALQMVPGWNEASICFIQGAVFQDARSDASAMFLSNGASWFAILYYETRLETSRAKLQVRLALALYRLAFALLCCRGCL